MIIKGVNGAKIYGNTLTSTLDLSYGISTENHTTETSNLKIKNNILDIVGTPISIVSGAAVGLESDYNVIFAAGNISLESAQKTFSEWQGLGFDVNGVNSNPNLTNLIPTPKIEIGVDLGASYDDGLDTSTEWNTPTIVTKQQGATWQVGAYIQD